MWRILSIWGLLALVHSAEISLSDLCGVKLSGTCPNKISLKVIGGSSTCAEKVPWNVLIELTTDASRASDGGILPYCGGSLITERHVLSAAHCFWSNLNQFGTCPSEYGTSSWKECQNGGCPASCTRVGPNDIILHLGLTNRLQRGQGTTRQVESIEIHPGWEKGHRLNDILAGHDLALLTMTGVLKQFDRSTVPICLPSPNDGYLIEPGRTADVAGFGVVISPRDGSKNHPAEVQSARLSITSADNCRRFWSTRGRQVCAAGTEVIPAETSEGQNLVADSCNGDSGGGLTAANVDGREVLLGVISFGEPDCGRQGGKPGVYTNVMDHLDWIRGIIGDRNGNDGGSSGGVGGPGVSVQQCVASNGKPCRFPFRFRGQLYASCTTDHDSEGKPWCSTQTDADANHIAGTGEWGHCPASCTTNILTTPRTDDNGGGTDWSPWSACSVTCGRGQRVRTNNFCPRAGSCSTRQSQTCQLPACSSNQPAVGGGGDSVSWSAWGPCSRSCGGGTQTRSLRGSNIVQTQGCALEACPPLSSFTQEGEEGGNGGGGGEGSSEYQTGSSTTWIVGGSEEGGASIEGFVANKDDRNCAREVGRLPDERSSCMGGAVDGRVYVCGGSSGTFEDSRVHNTCFSTPADNPGQGWQLAASMPVNTSHAAYAVLKRKLYVFGGYTKPVCGYRPAVQIFNHDSQTWSNNPAHDPPLPVGAYGCAAATTDRIYLTGGWYTPDSYTTECKEESTDNERTVFNREIDYYLNRVQVYRPDKNQWTQAPVMIRPRRNHGCTIVNYQGKKGVLVAGGYNSNDYFMNHVEFLDLSGSGSEKWRELPPMHLPRGSRLGIATIGPIVHVLGGDLEEKTTTESFNFKTQTWKLDRKRLIKRRSYATFITNIQTTRSLC